MAASTLSRSERPPTVTQLSSARYRHWPFRCCSSPGLFIILLAADTRFVLNDDPAVLDLTRQVIRQRLGLGDGRNAGGS